MMTAMAFIEYKTRVRYTAKCVLHNLNGRKKKKGTRQDGFRAQVFDYSTLPLQTPLFLVLIHAEFIAGFQMPKSTVNYTQLFILITHWVITSTGLWLRVNRDLSILSQL